jgi:hypothetical protein
MTITLELPPDLEARLVAEAKAKNLPIDELVKAYLYRAPSDYGSKTLSPAEVDLALDEAADLIPEGIPPISNHGMSRESIYTREDDWNR